jgi:acetyltransferase-like isoleucine patch superfamily enzyme
MSWIEFLGSVRRQMIQLPHYIFYALLWWIYPTTILRNKAAMCPYPKVRWLMLTRSGIRIGQGVEIGLGIMIVGRGKCPPAVELGNRVAVGPRVTFITCCIPGCSRLLESAEIEKLLVGLGPIRVDEDAWLGAGAILMPGITIGRGAIVGAGAVVTHDVDPHTVVAGIPARVIRTLSVTATAHANN